MADSLKSIIATFDDAAAAELEHFLRLNPGPNYQGLDWRLFQLLRDAQPHSSEEIAIQLYGENERYAYYALRKRLTHTLAAFVAMRSLSDSSTAAGQVMAQLSMARYLFAHSLPDLAWDYLQKAEKAGFEYEQYKPLQEVLALQIELAHRRTDIELDEILAKYTTVKQWAEEEDRVLIAHSVIRQRISAQQKLGIAPDFTKTVGDVLETWGLSHIELLRPRLLFDVVSAVRAAFLASKNFTSFEPYLLEKYTALAARGGFEVHHRYYHLQLLYFISHVLFRNRKFEQAKIYLQTLDELLQAKSSHTYRQTFLPRYTLLLAGIHFLQGDNKTAIALHEAYLANPESSSDVVATLNAYLNLCGFYFAEGNYKIVLLLYRKFPRKDTWCERHLGREWLLKKHLLEVMLQTELGNDTVVLRRLHTISRTYADMIDTNRPTYNRARLFFVFIRRLLETPEWMQSEEARVFFKQFVVRENRQEDTQALLFYAWMKSKMENQPYYATLQEIVQQV